MGFFAIGLVSDDPRPEYREAAGSAVQLAIQSTRVCYQLHPILVAKMVTPQPSFTQPPEDSLAEVHKNCWEKCSPFLEEIAAARIGIAVRGWDDNYRSGTEAVLVFAMRLRTEIAVLRAGGKTIDRKIYRPVFYAPEARPCVYLDSPRVESLSPPTPPEYFALLVKEDFALIRRPGLGPLAADEQAVQRLPAPPNAKTDIAASWHQVLTPERIGELALTRIAGAPGTDAVKAAGGDGTLQPAADLREEAERLGYDVTLVDIGRAFKDGHIQGEQGRWGRCRLKLRRDSFFSWLAQNVKQHQDKKSIHDDQETNTDNPSKGARSEIEERKKDAQARKLTGRNLT
jgi:hypothetical protein